MSGHASTKTSRLDRDDRRDALLDVAAAIVASDGADEVSMENVAEQAGVSRPLVYKHFANRAELLEALYARESDALHQEISAAVTKARTLEEMFRALVRGSLNAQASRGATFAALRAAGGRSAERRNVQRSRDRTTLQYFVRQAMRQYELTEAQARAGVSILLGAVDSVLSVFRVRPTREHAELLENTYVMLVVGGLEGLHPKGSAR
ncbi:MAG TPA: helix-turn-helix domain-containing protein [Acidimicrobiales bacterium]|nr:helix-turn-helix domain-containing protein [Acidimicrobiales bacterium]